MAGGGFCVQADEEAAGAEGGEAAETGAGPATEENGKGAGGEEEEEEEEEEALTQHDFSITAEPAPLSSTNVDESFPGASTAEGRPCDGEGAAGGGGRAGAAEGGAGREVASLLPALFDALEAARAEPRAELRVREFSLSQQSLEHVLLRLTRQQQQQQ